MNHEKLILAILAVISLSKKTLSRKQKNVKSDDAIKLDTPGITSSF